MNYKDRLKRYNEDRKRRNRRASASDPALTDPTNPASVFYYGMASGSSSYEPDSGHASRSESSYHHDSGSSSSSYDSGSSSGGGSYGE